jgi:hypothetical protein
VEEIKQRNSGERSLPSTQKLADNQASLGVFFNPPEQNALYDTLVLPPNYLNVQNSQFRYVGKSFWGFVNGQVCFDAFKSLLTRHLEKANQSSRNV